MEGNSGSSLLSFLFSVFITITAVLSQESSLSPGPNAFVKKGSNVTFLCSTSIEWKTINFNDYGLRNDGPNVAAFAGNATSCRTFFVFQGYSTLPCYVSTPIGLTIHNIPATYHNKTISCQVNNKEPINTTVKIREMLTIPILEPLSSFNVKEGLFVSLKCTAQSIPKSIIEWYLGGSKLTVAATTSSPGENKKISTITFKAKKVDNTKKVYCSANDSFEAMNSLSGILNILYVPEVYIEPQSTHYLVYEGQENIMMTCRIASANPVNIIQYQWILPGGITVKHENLTIPRISKTVEGFYSCNASNTVGTSNITTTQIEVQYGPVITIPLEQNVTEGTDLSVLPTIESNPTDNVVWWTRLNDTNFIQDSPLLQISNIQKPDADNYTCHVQITLTPSGLPAINKTEMITFLVNVQYTPAIHIYPEVHPFVLYSGQENVSLKCIVDDANPLNGITYHWTSPRGIGRGQTYSIKNVSKNDSGNFSCIAGNVIGNSSVFTKKINVHYGPLISNISNTEVIVEGNDLIIYPIVESNPTARFVWWKRQNDAQFRFDS